MRTRRSLITAIALLTLIITITIAGADFTRATEAHDGTGQSSTADHAHNQHHTHPTKPWQAGSRCIYAAHITKRHTNDNGTVAIGHHDGFTSPAYTIGPAKGILPAKNLALTRRHISNTWEVDLRWTASGYNASSKTWACQPYQYQAQRKIGNGSWERWNTSHPDSTRFSETRSQRKQGTYPASDRSQYKHPTTGSPETVQFRVCNKAKNGAIGACTSPISTQLGGNPWHPEITPTITNKPIWEDTSTIQLLIEATPHPPDGATDVTIEVSFNVDKANDDFELVTSHNVHISANGTGSLSVTNPFTRTGTDFTEDESEPMRVKLAAGANQQDTAKITLNILDDDPIPITVDFPDDNPATYAVDGPNEAPTNLNPSGSANYAKRFEINFTSPQNIPTNNMGDTRCPKLSGEWSLRFQSSNTTVVSDRSLSFGCSRSGNVTVLSAGTFTITPASQLTHDSQGWTRNVAISGDTSFSGTVHASNSILPSKLGVGFAASRSTAEEGAPFSITVNGYDFRNQNNPTSCDTSAGQYNVTVTVIDANSQTVDRAKTVQLSRHCSAEAVFDLPHGTIGPLTVSFASTGNNVEQRGGYAAHFITVAPDMTNIQASAPSVTVNEGGPTRTVSLRLTNQPTADVTILLKCGDLNYVKVTCSADHDPLTFTTTDWNIYQAITFTGEHDGSYVDRHWNKHFTAASADPAYDKESITIQLTKINDDQGPPLKFASSLSTSLNANDKVTIRTKLPFYEPATKVCRVSYIRLWTYRENLVSDDEHEHTHASQIDTYFQIPEADEYASGVYEHVGAYDTGQEFLRVRHYEDGRDSDVEIYDYTPSESKNGRIKLYAISSVTKCKGTVDRWTTVPKPEDYAGCSAVGNSNGSRLCRWVDYSAD